MIVTLDVFCFTFHTIYETLFFINFQKGIKPPFILSKKESLIKIKIKNNIIKIIKGLFKILFKSLKIKDLQA